MNVADSCTDCDLRFNKLFCNLPIESLRNLDEIKYINAFPKGAVLFYEGQSSRGVLIVCRGRIKLSRQLERGQGTDHSDRNGRRLDRPQRNNVRQAIRSDRRSP